MQLQLLDCIAQHYTSLHYTNYITLRYNWLQLQLQLQLQLSLHCTTLHYTNYNTLQLQTTTLLYTTLVH